MDVPRSYSGSAQLVGMGLAGRLFRHALFVYPQEPDLPRLFSPRFRETEFLYDDYALYLGDRGLIPEDGGAGIELVFSDRAPEGGPWPDLAAVFLPKSKDLSRHALAQTARRLEPGATVLVVGPKKGGIRSSRPLIEEFVGPVESSRSARHCVLFEARRGGSETPFEGRREISVEVWGRNFPLVFYPGVFSYGELDPGTRFLLETLDRPRFAKALDWGCGAGVIGTALQLACPEGRVDFIDSSAHALRAARETLSANGLEPELVWPSDGFSHVRERYDLIVSNPPFHRGLRSDLTRARGLVEGAGRHLTGAGRLVLVVQRFLNILPVLRERARTVRVVDQNPRYRVLEVRDCHP
jgi:16S rRNA (guanine1207-N2)-methyltransferase